MTTSEIVTRDSVSIPNYPEKSGWPWTSEVPFYFATMSDGTHWPKISIITPSYNQGKYLEEAIRSVLLQGYPNLEYIVMDGGSTDESLEIIKKYEPWLTFWVSEKDNGQCNAINRGFSMATGELAGWLNSDDIYFPGAFETIATWWVKNGKPDDLITGTKLKGTPGLDEISRLPQEPFTIEHILERCIVEQPSTFYSLKAFRAVGGLDERYHNSLDYDLWLRLIRQGARIQFIDADFAVSRVHLSSKTSQFQRRACRESMLSVWRNYKVIPDSWIKKWVTAVVEPQKAKSIKYRNFLLLIRNFIYGATSVILKMFVAGYQFVNRLINVSKPKFYTKAK